VAQIYPWALGSLLSPLTDRRATVEVFLLSSTRVRKTFYKRQTCLDAVNIFRLVCTVLEPAEPLERNSILITWLALLSLFS
jgi:hypothetical protein